MTSTTSVTVAAVIVDCADPAALADFWGKALGRPAGEGAAPGDMAVDATDPASGPRMVFHPVSELGAGKNRLRLVLVTDQHDEETERLTGLGARLVDETRLPEIRHTEFADPEGNGFDLVTWQSR